MTALVGRDQLHAEIQARAVTVVDALGGDYYARQHLPGAVPVVEADTAERVAALLPDPAAPIVTYCSNPACQNSQRVADKLTALGYTNVRKYREGIEDWTAAGLPTESGQLVG